MGSPNHHPALHPRRFLVAQLLENVAEGSVHDDQESDTCFNGLEDKPIWGVPKIGGTILGVPMKRIVIFWGLSWVPLFKETTIFCQAQKCLERGCGDILMAPDAWKRLSRNDVALAGCILGE